jgi:leucyl/phenylalanyl-tRNA--protein transferase
MKLQADDLINGYRNGIFPMADADGSLYWYSPEPRAIIPINTYSPPKSLRPVLNKKLFDIRINTAFEEVIRACAKPRGLDNETWISEEIIEAYTQLHQLGMAFSVEAYRNDQLVGGLYGVSIGSAFFGESMFYTEPNASKVAFHYLIEILKLQGYKLLDTQFINDNVKRYGAIEIPRADYAKLLRKALEHRCHFIETDLQHLFSLQN